MKLSAQTLPLPEAATDAGAAERTASERAIAYWLLFCCGMIFYTGDLFPAWRGNALIGSLTQGALVRLAVDQSRVTGEEIIPLGVRIRDVAQGPDGAVYLLTDHDDGNLLRLRPER